MPHYRLHIMDKRGGVTGAVDLECTNDEAARERAEGVLGDHCGELWRLVSLVEAGNPPVPPDSK